MKQREEMYEHRDSTYTPFNFRMSSEDGEKIYPYRLSRNWEKMVLAIISVICVVAILFIMQQQTIIQENANMAQYDHTWTYYGFVVFIAFVFIANILIWRKK